MRRAILLFALTFSQDSVTCYERVTAFLNVPSAAGKHLLEGRWYRPDGRQQEYTRVELGPQPANVNRFQLWLELDRAGDAVDPWYTNVGEDALDGRWTLDVFWDGKRVATRKFEVRCA